MSTTASVSSRARLTSSSKSRVAVIVQCARRRTRRRLKVLGMLPNDSRKPDGHFFLSLGMISNFPLSSFCTYTGASPAVEHLGQPHGVAVSRLEDLGFHQTWAAAARAFRPSASAVVSQPFGPLIKSIYGIYDGDPRCARGVSPLERESGHRMAPQTRRRVFGHRAPQTIRECCRRESRSPRS